MTVSMVSRCYETETHPITYDEIWLAIRHGEHGLKEKIGLIRSRYESEKVITGSSEKAKKFVADLKLELPGFLPSGTFTKRANEALVDYSAILCADLDSLGDRLDPIRNTLKDMAFIRAIALSPSGDGLKVFFNVINDPVRHEDSFRSIQMGIRESLDVEIDEKCKDLARICFFTYDPDLWVRDEGNEIFPPADPLPRGNSSAETAKNLPNLTTREQIAFRLLGELNPAPEKGGYFVRCPGESFHTNKTAGKHTILYLESVPTLSCQHESCDHAVEAFNRVLRSEIGKAEYVPSFNGERPKPPAESDDETSWLEHLNRSAISATELSGLHIVPRKNLIGDWCCEGDLGFFFGPRGAGKTWFTLGFVQAVTTGGKFGDWEAPEAIRVLYIDGEMPPDSMQSRIVSINSVNDNLMILNHAILFDRTNKTVNITNPSIQQGLTDFCSGREIKMLILDNLSTLGVGMKENDSDSWELVNAWLLHLRRKGIAVVIIHHSGRSGQMRGTSRREDNVFWIIGIDDMKKESEDAGARFVTRFTKPSRNTPNDIPDFEWHFQPDDITKLVKVNHKISHSLSMFRTVIESGVTKPSEIAKVMRIEDYQVSRLAHKAIGAGWLERQSRGEYALIKGK